MREWTTLNEEERAAARGDRSHSENRQRMDDCLAAVLAMVKGDDRATRRAWKMIWGNYLINTPEEIVAYLKEGKA